MMLHRAKFAGTILTSFFVAGMLSGAGCTPTTTVTQPDVNVNAGTNVNVSVTDPIVPPTDWSTFASPLMHYTIDYPTTWHTWSGSETFTDMTEAETDVDYFSVLPRADSFTIAADQVFIAIDLDTKQPLVPGEEATETFNDVITANSKDETVSNVQALVIDGNLPAVQQVEEDPDDATGEYGYSVATYIDADNVVYTIYVTTASAEEYARYAEVIQTIIESFALNG